MAPGPGRQVRYRHHVPDTQYGISRRPQHTVDFAYGFLVGRQVSEYADTKNKIEHRAVERDILGIGLEENRPPRVSLDPFSCRFDHLPGEINAVTEVPVDHALLKEDSRSASDIE